MSEDNLQILKFKEQPLPNKPVLVTHCLVVKKDLTWQVSVHGHTVSGYCAPLSAVPKYFTKKDIHLFLTTVTNVY